MSGFLRYVVERALAGESDQVKEYVIGVAVFGRDEQYDPRLDSIVRVEARRLRTKLDEYYADEGRDDPIVIQMRRGSYAATFERRPRAVVGALHAAAFDGQPRQSGGGPGPRRSSSQSSSRFRWASPSGARASGRLSGARRRWSPSPCCHSPSTSNEAADTLLAARLTDGVTSELARIRTIGVVSHTSAQQFAGTRRPLREIAQALNAEMILEARVLKDGDGVRVEARLVDAARIARSGSRTSSEQCQICGIWSAASRHRRRSCRRAGANPPAV